MEKLRPLFILGVHKSGTSLMRSIFDSHSEVISIPIESHYFDHFGFPYHYPLNKRGVRNVNVKESLDKLISEYLSDKNQYADASFGRDQFKEGKVLLLNELKDPLSPDSYLEFAKYIYESFGLYQKDKHRYVLEKSVDNLEYAELLLRIFPEAKFIHVIRNPYDNFASIKRYLMRGGRKSPPVAEIVELMKYNQFYLERFENIFPKDIYTVVKYETFINEPASEIDRLINFLGIKYEDALVQPTSLGQPWKGNSTTDAELNRIEKVSKLVAISKFEKEVIDRNLNYVLSKYNEHRVNLGKEGVLNNYTLKGTIHNYLYRFFDHL